MGDGLVLEKGTHTELLRDKDGPYSRLVTAQKLREEKENTEELNDATSEGEIEDKIKAELTAKRASKRASHRMSTVYSVASEMLAEKKRELWGESQQESDISLFQLCVQLAKINRDGRSSYVIGFLAACCMYSFSDLQVSFLISVHSDWYGLPLIRCCLRQGYHCFRGDQP